METSQEDLNQFVIDLADFLRRYYSFGFERLTLEREIDEAP